MLRVKDLVAGHDRDQIFRLGQVNDIMRPTGNHVDGFDLIPRDLKFHRFASIDVPLLNQSVTGNHDEQFPFGVVPVLPLGDAGLTDIDACLLYTSDAADDV